MSPIPSLPSEIIDNILGGLTDEKASLRRCASVSHTFLFYSRKRLFSYIHLGYVEQQRHLTCARLFEVLSATPDIISFIQHLSIVGGDWLRHEPTLIPLLLCIAQSNRLQKLDLSTKHKWGTLINSQIQNSFQCLLSSTSLRSVVLSGVFEVYFPIKLLATSPALNHLSITQIDPSRIDPSRYLIPLEIQIIKTLPLLESLEINGPFPPKDAGTHSLPPTRLSHLRKFQITGSEGRMGDAAWEVMKAASTSLERLVWRHWSCSPYTLSENDAVSDLPSVVDLRAMERLQFVELHLSHSFEWAASVLDGWGMPQSIEGLTLVFDLKRYYILTAPSASEQLDQVLASFCDKTAFPHLQSIDIEILLMDLPALDVTQRKTCLGQCFPRLKATGYLGGGFFKN